MAIIPSILHSSKWVCKSKFKLFFSSLLKRLVHLWTIQIGVKIKFSITFFFASPYQQTQLSMIATRKHHCVLDLALEWFYLTMSYAIKKRQENRFFMKFCSLCDFLVLTVDTFIRGFILTRPVRKSNKSKKSHIFKFFEWKRLLWSFKRIPQVFEVLK